MRDIINYNGVIFLHRFQTVRGQRSCNSILRSVRCTPPHAKTRSALFRNGNEDGYMGRPVVGSRFCSIRHRSKGFRFRFFFSEMSPALIRVFTASAAVARLLSYGAPRRSDLTIINDAIKVTTLICSRYTPRVKQVGGRRESLGRRCKAINHPGRGAETILINRYSGGGGGGGGGRFPLFLSLLYLQIKTETFN